MAKMGDAMAAAAWAAVFLLGGCTGSGTVMADDPLPLTELPAGTRWVLDGADLLVLQGDAARAVRLEIQDGRLGGNSGCNHFGGGFRMIEGRLQVGSIAATKIGCPGERAEVERALFEVLPRLVQAAMHGEHLWLSTESGETLRFAPAPPPVDR